MKNSAKLVQTPQSYCSTDSVFRIKFFNCQSHNLDKSKDIVSILFHPGKRLPLSFPLHTPVEQFGRKKKKDSRFTSCACKWELSYWRWVVDRRLFRSRNRRVWKKIFQTNHYCGEVRLVIQVPSNNFPNFRTNVEQK